MRMEIVVAVGSLSKEDDRQDNKILVIGITIINTCDDRHNCQRLGAYCEAKEFLPEEQYGFRPDSSTTDMIFVVCRLQKNGWNAGVYLFMCFVDLQKAYDAVDRTLLWQVLTRIGVPSQIIAVIQQFHDGMRACVRSDDGVCSD